MIIETRAALNLLDKIFKKHGTMKTRKNELDVDFIGGAGPLTKEEEKRISEVIRAMKAKRLSKQRPTTRRTTKKKVGA